ncbi:hypothetical protein GCM10018791_05350 [Streptomyces zaomyceticus]|nr:hypothetical protein GCM10018791_05350 [Streptomyces zaomyceticus]
MHELGEDDRHQGRGEDGDDDVERLRAQRHTRQETAGEGHAREDAQFASALITHGRTLAQPREVVKIR